MLLKIFSIYDEKAAAYLPPFFLPRMEQAERTFSDCCNDKTHQFGLHPEDYTLYKLGVFDDATGIIEDMKNPLPIGKGLNYIIKDLNPNQAEMELHSVKTNKQDS